jgi:hypothetical protein
VALVWLVLGDLPIDAGELNAARRRAMLVLAAGGDPHRDLGFDSVAAERLAGELDSAPTLERPTSFDQPQPP